MTSVIGLSISFEEQALLARGLGLEHLRELIIRLARPILRSGADLVFGGHWIESDENLTYEILRLISAEQEDNTLGGPDSNLTIGRLRNHLAWPYYLTVTPRIEAQWILACRIIRITQELSGIAPGDVAPDSEPADTDRYLLNSAVTLSAMRRFATEGMNLPVPGTPDNYTVPRLTARVIIGGKTTGYHGFVPGVLEEALLAMEGAMPLYVLGGFGGAAQLLAQALLGAPVPELECAWQESATPAVGKLRELAAARVLPPGVRNTSDALTALRDKVALAQPSLSATLRTGLDELETRELLATPDMGRAVQLVLKGLANTSGFVLLRT